MPLAIGVVQSIRYKKPQRLWFLVAIGMFGYYLVLVNTYFSQKYTSSQQAAQHIKLFRPTYSLEGYSGYEIRASTVQSDTGSDYVEIISYKSGQVEPNAVWIHRKQSFPPTECQKLYELEYRDMKCNLVGKTGKGYPVYSRSFDGVTTYVADLGDVLVVFHVTKITLSQFSKYVDALQPSELPPQKFHFYSWLND